MAVINPDHLLDQAKSLIAAGAAGAPRQVDLRRAVSNAYYAVFHLTTTAVADTWVGNTKRTTTAYALAYRSVGHKALKELCADLQKTTVPSRYLAYLPPAGLGVDFVRYAAAVVDLQEKRHRADYDPLEKITLSDAKLAIEAAEKASTSFLNTSEAEKMAFASLLSFGIRT